uniref:RRM domain-containing protein n=1 Tax=Macrostomum lignano TaxID=282301 RepID=A0A1I8HHT2_9PLAT
MSGGTVLIRLQNLAWSANASDIRRFFNGLAIPEGGVHIVGGDRGDAFVTFTSDETARLALLLDGQELCGQTLKLFVSSNAEMQHVVQQVRLAAVAPAEEPQPPTTPTPPPLREQPNQGPFEHSAGYRGRGYGRADQRPYPRERFYPEADARQHTGGSRYFPADTAVAAYENDAAAAAMEGGEGRSGGGPASDAAAAAAASALNAYSNIYSGGEDNPPSTSLAAAYSSSRDPRLAGRNQREPVDSTARGPVEAAAAIESEDRSSFYNEHRDPRFKGELYNAEARSRPADEAKQPQPQLPLGSASSSGRSRERDYKAEEEGYVFYKDRGQQQQRGGRYAGGRGGSHHSRPYDDTAAAEFGDSGGRRGRQSYDNYEMGEEGGGPRGGWRGRGRGGRGGGGPSNGFPAPYSESGGYRPKPWIADGSGGSGPAGSSGFQLLPQPPVGDDDSVAAAFRQLCHPGRPKSLLGPAPSGPPPNWRSEAAQSPAAAAAELPNQTSLQPPPMPQLPREALPDYTKGPRDEHFIALAGLPLDPDYSDACAALPGIRLALSDVKFETDALGRRTGQAFVRLVEPADVLRAISQSVTDDSGRVHVSASCEHEFRCANDPDFTGDADDPDIGGGSGGVEFPPRPSPYYLDCCLEVNGLPQPIVAEDLLTVFGDDRAIADMSEDLHLDRSKDPNSVTAYLRFDGFERFAEATRSDVTQLAPCAYFVAISRLQFASYRAASLRCGDAGAEEDDEDDEEVDDQGRPSKATDFRRPPIGFQRQQPIGAVVKQKNPQWKKSKPDRALPSNKTDEAC